MFEGLLLTVDCAQETTQFCTTFCHSPKEQRATVDYLRKKYEITFEYGISISIKDIHFQKSASVELNSERPNLVIM